MLYKNEIDSIWKMRPIWGILQDVETEIRNTRWFENTRREFIKGTLKHWSFAGLTEFGPLQRSLKIEKEHGGLGFRRTIKNGAFPEFGVQIIGAIADDLSIRKKYVVKFVQPQLGSKFERKVLSPSELITTMQKIAEEKELDYKLSAEKYALAIGAKNAEN